MQQENNVVHLLVVYKSYGINFWLKVVSSFEMLQLGFIGQFSLVFAGDFLVLGGFYVDFLEEIWMRGRICKHFEITNI